MDSNAGQIVERVVRRNKVSISELARRMRVNRRSVYNWFEQKSLKIDIIWKIGQVLNYDFSSDFPDAFCERGLVIKEEIDEIDNNGSKHPNSVHYWMVKYISLLEKYNMLLLQEAGRNESHLNDGDIQKSQSKSFSNTVYKADTLPL